MSRAFDVFILRLEGLSPQLDPSVLHGLGAQLLDMKAIRHDRGTGKGWLHDPLLFAALSIVTLVTVVTENGQHPRKTLNTSSPGVEVGLGSREDRTGQPQEEPLLGNPPERLGACPRLAIVTRMCRFDSNVSIV